MAQGTAHRYTPTVPATSRWQNADLNAVGSTYSSTYGITTADTGLIQRIVRELIYDASPEQYMDLKLLSMKTPKQVPSDEFFYHEMGFGRDPVVINAINAGGVASTTLTVVNSEMVSEDTIVVYPDNTKAVVTAINSATSIDVTAHDSNNGGTLSALVVGDVLSILSPVEADGADDIAQYFRQETVERFNYVQMLIKAVRFGRMELFKYNNAGTTSNYITLQKQRCVDQFRVDLSNILWNGERGELVLAGNERAKTAGGIYPLMVGAGSFSTTSTLANLKAAVEDAALSTEFKRWGYTRFLYGSPRLIYEVSQAWKEDKVRYRPDDRMGDVYLDSVNIGSSRIVFVPMQRFEETSCFPTEWANRLILLDQESVTPVECWGEEMGQTLPRKDNGTRENFQDFWISSTFSIEFNNPLGSAIINVS